MRPLPSVATAYGMLIHEEKQRQIQAGSPFIAEHTSLNANLQTSFRGRMDDKKEAMILPATIQVKIAEMRASSLQNSVDNF
ncbi:unnamed protein product [Cuscuta campestris]|uniref:Uncharacterized protein n=1 Tax=Cuscuta campestris TaxID=132261 RepID=A0A484JYN3_9ASTE|nr:unnamed protein product [Cuscuta campestris]